MSNTFRALALLLAAGLAMAPAFAADDPSIQGQLRADIQQAMNDFIEEQAVDGVLSIYDPLSDGVLHLTLKELHAGIVRKGDYFVSCADFVAPDGQIIDLDFLVREVDGKVRTTQAIVHKVGGEKRPYRLEPSRP